MKCRWREKTVLQDNFDLMKKFDLMINFDFFFDLITWDSLMVWAWNLICGRFMKFQNGRKILTLLTFGCPNYNLRRQKPRSWPLKLWSAITRERKCTTVSLKTSSDSEDSKAFLRYGARTITSLWRLLRENSFFALPKNSWFLFKKQWSRNETLSK